MIAALFSFVLGGFLVGAVAMHRGSRHVEATTRRERWIKFATYFAIVNGVLLSALAGRAYFAGLMLLLYLMGATELVRAEAQAGALDSPGIRRIVCGAVYLFGGGGLALFVQRFQSGTFLFVYLVVAVFDAFSQLTGQLLGRHKLAPRISPKKTVEGLMGGFVAALLTAGWMRSLAGLGLAEAIMAALVLGGSALAGDLTASKVKRICGLKDFGTWLPGHGGVLDRFDSFFAAAPAFVVFSRFISHETF